ncbi:MAG: endonuclease MutS2 [Planctomycetota bacterium]|jgi:DNA mismatch repair protein MutS2
MVNEDVLKILEYDTIRRECANFASSILGRQAALGAKPLESAEEIKTLHREASELKRVIADGTRIPIQGMHDFGVFIRDAVENNRPLEPKQLLDIESTLKAGNNLREYFLGLDPDANPALRALGEKCISYGNVIGAIEDAIDRRGFVADDASPRLSNLRRDIEELKRELRRKIDGIIRRKNMKRYLQEDNITLRDGRFVLPVKASHKQMVRGIIHGKSQTGETIFIEPQDIVSDGNELSEVLFEESAEVTRILWSLTRIILAIQSELEELQKVLTRIDFAYARAGFSLAYFCEEPVIAAEGPFELHEARHPLLLILARKAYVDGKRSVDDGSFRNDVVPTSLRLGREFDMIIVTGPNTGGKTVALKNAGLCAAMALSGMHVPASRDSHIPVFSDILADIGDEQSIEQSLSTFSSHMARIVKILENATPETLVLIDELGSGTDPVEGAALGEAILDALLEKGAKALVTTHLGALKSFAYRKNRIENACVSFDIETLAPTFVLSVGQPGNSNAISIAERLGVAPEIIASARREAEGKSDRSTELISVMEELRSKSEKQFEAARQTRNETEELKAQAAKKLDEIDAQRETVEREADLAIDEHLTRARERILPLTRELVNAPKAVRDVVDKIEGVVEEEVAHTPLGERRSEFAHSLKKGVEVFVSTNPKSGLPSTSTGFQSRPISRPCRGPKRINIRGFEFGAAVARSRQYSDQGREARPQVSTTDVPPEAAFPVHNHAFHYFRLRDNRPDDNCRHCRDAVAHGIYPQRCGKAREWVYQQYKRLFPELFSLCLVPSFRRGRGDDYLGTNFLSQEPAGFFKARFRYPDFVFQLIYYPCNGVFPFCNFCNSPTGRLISATFLLHWKTVSNILNTLYGAIRGATED